MLPDDSEEAARNSANKFDDPRVYHFYDPNKLSGKAVADSLGYEGEVAWDIYLFYSETLEWKNIPPVPIEWMHQLKDSWIKQDNFRTGEDLTNELFVSLKKMLNE